MGRLPLLAATICAALVLAACGGGDDADDDGGTAASGGEDVPSTEVTHMTYDEWDAIEIGTQKDEIVGQFGEPANQSGSEYSETLSYTIDLANVQASFNFDPDSGELKGKIWSVSRGLGPNSATGKISEADYTRVELGMTEDEVIDLIGEPWETRDEVMTPEYATGTGGNPSGELQHCLEYTPPGKLANATICFDEPGGVVNWKINTENSKLVDLTK